ncbi:MAG: ATP-binding protein [Coxiellaceae bacterium]|nr:ATP-binding protein [Coxiellaceae bacterium]
MNYNRILNLPRLLEKKSHFLFGPRSTGKSYLIRAQFQNNYPVINLLRNEQFMQLSQSPHALEMIIDAHTDTSIVIIDEVQMIPELLNEVHRLIEERQIKFLLTGSSARKLKQKNTNLLAGRARKAELFPLTSQEIPDFKLDRYLLIGGLPAIYQSDEPFEDLSAYTDTYLKDEIQAEALVRHIVGFSRFLQTAALTSGKMTNFTSVASNVGIPVSTIREYYHILEDTFIGFMLPAYIKTKNRKAISTAKFYFFDIGVRNYLCQIRDLPKKTDLYGDAFEHFIAMELRSYLSYRRKHEDLCYWRSKSGFEVDFIIGDHTAIEVKSTDRINNNDMKGLNAFMEENIAKKYIIVSQDPVNKKTKSGISMLYWKDFLKHLWSDEI